MDKNMIIYVLTFLLCILIVANIILIFCFYYQENPNPKIRNNERV